MHDAQNLFHKEKEAMDKKPSTLITDGLRSYHDAFNKEFYTNTKPKTEHINTIRMQGVGYQIYHNYIREHQGLENKTPAEVSGIKIQGENKWITLIQNAKKENV